MALTVAVVLFGVEAGVDVMPLLETVETLPATQSIQLTALMSGGRARTSGSLATNVRCTCTAFRASS